MRKGLPIEFIYQVFALLIAIIVVHAVYVAVIRPNADAFLEAQLAQLEADPGHIPERSLYVVVRDFEQETCFILMLWAFSIMAYKGVNSHRQRRLLESELIDDDDSRILPGDAPPLSRNILTLSHRLREYLLPRALLAGLHRFESTGNVQDVAAAVRDVCASESDRLESELSIIRYIAWAIPSIGFIGTVRGISEALSLSHRAVEGDITGVTQSLGVAFNSTFIALVISIVVMFFVHQLQLLQERLVLDTETYCDRRLIRRLGTA